MDFIKARIFREPEQENNLLFGGATPIKPSLPKGVSARFGEESSFVQESRACDHRYGDDEDSLSSEMYPENQRYAQKKLAMSTERLFLSSTMRSINRYI